MKQAILLMILLGAGVLALSAIPSKVDSPLEDINVSPNPMDKFTTISLVFNEPVQIGVSIETDTGEVIKSLYWGSVDEFMQVSWDRLDENGVMTPSGKYYVVVNFQTRYTSVKKTLILK